MSLALLLALQLGVTTAQGPCNSTQAAAAAHAEQLIVRGDDRNGREALSTAVTSGACRQLMVAVLALDGWNEARALAPAGGAADRLGPVEGILEQLKPFVDTDDKLEAEYAETAIRAAIAAAQDERPEMELLLTHARDLSERLQLRGRRAVWPRTLNVLAGELWFEVDRYDEARAAFQRAVSADPSPAALVGLARTLARLGQPAAACATYRRVTDAAPALLASAATDLGRCR